MIDGYIDIHTHNSCEERTCVRSYALGRGDKEPDNGIFSAGIHPWDADWADLEEAIKYLQLAPLAAVGEIGLDYARDVDRQRQIEVFRQQLEIAQQRSLPVILHCVKAYNDVLLILKDYSLQAVIFHGYIGSLQQTEQLIDLGYYISIGENSLRSPKTIDSIKATPDDRIFAETDDSDTTISLIYTKLADIKGIRVDDLKTIINDNYKTIFK